MFAIDHNQDDVGECSDTYSKVDLRLSFQYQMDTKIFYHEALQLDKLHQSIGIDQKIVNSNI